MALTFQLIYNGQIEEGTDQLVIMRELANILEVDISITGTFFTGRQIVIYATEDFAIAREKQQALENIGLNCDIKPTETKRTNNNADISTSGNAHYKSTFKTPDDDYIPNIKPQKDQDFIYEIPDTKDMSMAGHDDGNISPKQKQEEHNIDTDSINFDEFDADFDHWKD